MPSPARCFVSVPPPAVFSGRVSWVGLIGLLSLLTASGADIAPRMLLLDGALAGDTVVAVGERGTILRSTDRAQTWQAAAAPTHATLTGVSFAADGRHGWAVGHDALILGSSDGGATWARQFQGENLQDSFLDVLALDATRAIAVGAYGLFISTTDGGRTWERRSAAAGDFHLNRISRGPTGTLYLAGESGTLLRSTDAGQTWTAIRAPYEGSFYGITTVGERTLLAYGLRGHLYRSTDDGEHWSKIPVSEPVQLVTTATGPSGVIWIAGQARTLLVSEDGGKTVAALANAPETAIAELLDLGQNTVLALGEAGALRLDLAPGRVPTRSP